MFVLLDEDGYMQKASQTTLKLVSYLREKYGAENVTIYKNPEDSHIIYKRLSVIDNEFGIEFGYTIERVEMI